MPDPHPIAITEDRDENASLASVGKGIRCVDSARHRHGVDARMAIAQQVAVEENLP